MAICRTVTGKTQEVPEASQEHNRTRCKSHGKLSMLPNPKGPSPYILNRTLGFSPLPLTRPVECEHHVSPDTWPASLLPVLADGSNHTPGLSPGNSCEPKLHQPTPPTLSTSRFWLKGLAWPRHQLLSCARQVTVSCAGYYYRPHTTSPAPQASPRPSHTPQFLSTQEVAGWLPS